MKHLILVLLVSLSAQNLKGQITLNDFEDAAIYFNGIFNYESKIDHYGNVVIDMGSASVGRVAFRISDVEIKMEERGEEPGCADICPPRVLLTFECTKTACLVDPLNFNNVNKSSTISISDIKIGRKSYEFLLAFQRFIIAEMCEK